MHRESWIPVIILMLSNLLRLPEQKVSPLNCPRDAPAVMSYA